MKKNWLSLDGEWNVVGWNAERNQEKKLKGIVPGHIHVDLLREGMIADPFWRDQAEACQWVEKWTWSYSKTFEIPADFSLEWCILEFKGLDTYAEIRLNGAIIGNTENMLMPHAFEVQHHLRHGSNQIQIQFTPYQTKIAGKRLDYAAAFFQADRMHVRRMQCTFYWDWVNRFVSAGIWQPVTLFTYQKSRIQDLFVYTRAIDPTSASLAIELETEKRTEDTIQALIEIIHPEGHPVWVQKMRLAEGNARLQADLPDPLLWWPNGSGEQPLYTCIVSLLSSNGETLDRTETVFGIRTVRIEGIKDKPGSPEWSETQKIRSLGMETEKNEEEPGESFTLIVNGSRIFCKGGNWVPADPFPSRISSERYDHLIKLAREANLNLLRCWGGGIYEPDAFWQACDRYGILVSQDFMMACGEYPEDDPEFMEKVRVEIPRAIKMLRNHTSLAWWSGDNENGMNHDFDDPVMFGRKISEQITGHFCRLLDPSRSYRPTSPYGGRTNSCLTIGDCHHSAWFDMAANKWDVQHYLESVKIVGRFMSESACAGSPSLDSLLRFMTVEDIMDPAEAMFEYHTKTNPHFPPGTPTLFQMQKINAEKIFGKPENLTERTARLGYIQHEWIRITMEAARRSKWYCSGLQYWMYNDCWPAVGWSVVDYYGIPKAGWYGLKRACKPVIASIEIVEDGVKIWVCNDKLQKISGQAHLYFQPWQGEFLWSQECSFTVEENTSRVITTLNTSQLSPYLTNQGILVCDITGDFENDRACYYPGIPLEMNAPPVELSYQIVDEAEREYAILSSSGYARVVTLEGNACFEDNYFDMLPGETRTIHWQRVEANREPIRISCWNNNQNQKE